MSGAITCPDCLSMRVLIVLKPDLRMGRCLECGALWMQRGSGPVRHVRDHDVVSALLAASETVEYVSGPID
jgi:hypothetical protein